MSRTVDNLLTLAQVDEGRLALLRTRVDLREAVEAAARPLRPLAGAQGDRALEIDGEPCEAQADPQRLHQALDEPDRERDQVHAARRRGARHARGERATRSGVTVADDGPGIPAEARAHVFDRFYRVDRARGRDAGGSGLGLAICREIALAHGGRVWVEDATEGRAARSRSRCPRDGAPRRAAPAASRHRLDLADQLLVLRAGTPRSTGARPSPRRA